MSVQPEQAAPWMPRAWSQAHEAHGVLCLLPRAGEALSDGDFSVVGRQYEFATALHAGVCKVLEVDKSATYLPIRIQFNSPEGHRRVIRVAPADILFWKVM